MRTAAGGGGGDSQRVGFHRQQHHCPRHLALLTPRAAGGNGQVINMWTLRKLILECPFKTVALVPYTKMDTP